MRRIYWIIALTTLFGACVSAPQALRGQYSAVTPQQVRNQNLSAQQRVRWGGVIISTTPHQTETCFEILGRALAETDLRPVESDTTQGRFIACAPGFYDPGVYVSDRDITVTGDLGRPTTGKVGGFDYRYPRVMADTVYLWPKLPRYSVAPAYYNDPFYSPFFPYYDPFYDPYFRLRHFRH